jgi:hypothetical protein
MTILASAEACGRFAGPERSQDRQWRLSARPTIQLPRGALALIQTNLVAHFPAEELTALLAKATGEMNLVTGTNEWRERRHISIDDWRHDVG